MRAVAVFLGALLLLVGCDKGAQQGGQMPWSFGAKALQCAKDTDCKGDRVCSEGKCSAPSAALGAIAPASPQAQPEAPAVKYEPLLVSDTGIGDVFHFSQRELGGMSIDYLSRAGVVNIMDSVVEDPDATAYVKVEKTYAFGDKYLFVVSTGEGGMSCPATTYAFTFDASREYVSGKTEIDGCSESVDTFADGNKLTVKKEGEASVFYNGLVK